MKINIPKYTDLLKATNVWDADTIIDKPLFTSETRTVRKIQAVETMTPLPNEILSMKDIKAVRQQLVWNLVTQILDDYDSLLDIDTNSDPATQEYSIAATLTVLEKSKD